MRVLRFLPLALLLSIPLFAQTTTPAAQRDPQAVALMESAITKMGGATAISQHQSWTFQVQMQGPLNNGTVTETLNTNPSMTVNGKTVTHPLIVSPFVPALVARLLSEIVGDASTSVTYKGTVSVGSKSATAIALSDPRSSTILQTWYFDSTTGLPMHVELASEVQVGLFKSFPGGVDFSDYRTVSGVLYPFQIVERIEGRPFVQTITVQSVTPTANPVPPAVTP